MNYYKLNHLTMASALDFPELVRTAVQRADVVLTEGNVPVHLSNASKKGSLWEDEVLYEVDKEDILLTINSVGRILLKHDNSIVVDKHTAADYVSIRHYILGTCFGFLLLRLAIFPFHGSAIHTQYGTVMFVGPSGWGKSTTAAKFIQEGHTLLTDDVCVVLLSENGEPFAYPSSHRIKLWDNSIEVLRYQPADYSTILPDWDKKQVYARHKFSTGPHPLTAIYALWPDDEDVLRLEPLKSHEKLMTLINNTFRLEGVDIFSLRKEQFLFCSAVAQSVPVVRLRRPTSFFAIDDLYELVMDDLKTNYISPLYRNEIQPGRATRTKLTTV